MLLGVVNTLIEVCAHFAETLIAFRVYPLGSYGGGGVWRKRRRKGQRKVGQRVTLALGLHIGKVTGRLAEWR